MREEHTEGEGERFYQIGWRYYNTFFIVYFNHRNPVIVHEQYLSEMLTCDISFHVLRLCLF